tara:strand:- start:2856 stop:3326 length:471 start_codon:yes stop_codon:yes gene_type:complete
MDYKAKHAEYMRNYMKNNPLQYKKEKFRKWEKYGLIDDYEMVYQRYQNTKNCDICNVLLTSYQKGGNQKQMDHCHKTGKFRNILCQRCNSADTTRIISKNQKYGHKGLTYVKKKGLWSYRKQNKRVGMNVKKTSKSKIYILCIKFAYLILLNHKLQ